MRSLSKLSDKLTEAWPLPPEEPAAISVSRAESPPTGRTDGPERGHALGAETPVALAVSGGADSFALLHWAWQAGKPIVALTVDHGLREGSALEAQAVRTFCSERNIPHETLIWRGDKPKTGIQEAARNARYRLLCQACERMGIEHLITAHTADDQAETVFMRLRRGAGRGLAGMPSERQIAAGPGELITLHRPMLNIRRTEARAYAEEHDVPFVDDPSNEDEKYERVKVRALLAALEQQDLLTVDALCRVSAVQRSDLSDAEELLDLEYDELAFALPDEHPYDSEDGGITLNGDGIEDQPIGLLGVVRLIYAISGSTPDKDELKAQFSGPELKSPKPIQTSGCRLVFWSDPKRPGSMVIRPGQEKRHLPLRIMAILREPAALLGRADGTPGFTPVPAAPGSKHLYDKRFIVEVPQDVAEGTVLRPLGQLLPRDIATSTLSRQRVATLPILAKGDRATHLPEQAVDAVRQALVGWKSCDEFLPDASCTFVARSLLEERFAGSVIRY